MCECALYCVLVYRSRNFGFHKRRETYWLAGNCKLLKRDSVPWNYELLRKYCFVQAALLWTSRSLCLLPFQRIDRMVHSVKCRKVVCRQQARRSPPVCRDHEVQVTRSWIKSVISYYRRSYDFWTLYHWLWSTPVPPSSLRTLNLVPINVTLCLFV
jgi:hypothetical protein